MNSSISHVIRNYYRQAPVTSALFIVMAALALITSAQSGSVENNLDYSSVGQELVLYGPDLSAAGVVGSMFVHVGIGHFVVNSFFLLLLGREIEPVVGSWLYGAVFVTAGVGAAAAVYVMDFYAPTAGASGALYGLMALLVALAFRRRADLRAPIVFIGINVLFSLISPGVSLWGHLGGLVSGALMTPVVLSNVKIAQWASIVVALVIAVGILVS